MKFGKVKVGMRVRVASNAEGNTFERSSHGRIGVVSAREGAAYNRNLHSFKLSTCVQFSDDARDWGSHLNLEEVKDEA
ncbi:hypothetical protein AIIMSE5_039 [Acinetobacter phage AIIMS-AbE5-RC]|uniref:Uncharacterized protein n=1 Tax=Acinetobacter phage AIIMS-AbE5-RC TaxID=2981552 RepID=A0A9X9JR64_9CAUD|nr:hypothetical protein AIIMSE5_039 [Acinetobacter phage AIIMS-AbE5-RC]